MATQSHTLHVNNATYVGANFGCITCHDTVSDDSTIAAGKYGQHVNAAVEVPGTSYTDGTADNVANGTCATNACHADGTETPGYVSVTWGGTDNTDNCKECHGKEAGSLAGAPWYANNTASYDTRNSHQSHVIDATSCVSCHSGTVNAAGALWPLVHLDLNGAADVSGTGIGSYTDATETCNTVTCHGGEAQWGGDARLLGCHMAATGRDGPRGEQLRLQRRDVREARSEDWITYGHGRPSGNDSGNGPRRSTRPSR
jgi:predicted CxxxxCH...CXXCH cytochrome family protein